MERKTIVGICCWIACGLVGCIPSQGPIRWDNALTPHQAKDMPYLIRPLDQLDIVVTGMPDMSRKVLVREDGFFTFPGIGDLLAERRSVKEVQDDLERKLRMQYAERSAAPSDTTGKPAEVVSAQIAAQQTYRLQAGDQIRVEVWQHADLSKDITVGEDGSFSFPLIGLVQAQGRTIREVEREIAERLDRDFVVNPEVSARLASVPFTILGSVAKPGSYVAGIMPDLLTALHMAGGVTHPDVTEVEIARKVGDRAVVIPVRLTDLRQGIIPNLSIFPQDIITVKPPSAEIRVTVHLFGAKYTVIGEVDRPGSYPLEGQMDLLTAISQAGGIGKFGSSTVEIVRDAGGTRRVIRANMNRILQGKDPNVAIHPHDIIHIRRRLF